MENFQLFRTNILLGGQMKLDLILNSYSGKLLASDIHITPISKHSTNYTMVEENLLNYSHQENVKSFYNRTQSEFYDNCLDERLKHEWVLVDNKLSGDVYDDSVEAGTIMANYQKYFKAFEVFCPVWLEDMMIGDKVKDINFRITAYYESDGEEKKLCSKVVQLSQKMKSYFESYIKHIQPDDSLLELDLYNKKAYVTGVQVDTGNVVKLPVHELVYNILHRERPMLEFDAMLINNFKNNKLISKQLFNFNLCFNIEDLLSSYLSDMIYGKKLRFVGEVLIDGKSLPLRDFYSNYEYIPRTNIDIRPLYTDEDSVSEVPNVLNYMADYRCAEFTTKNKFAQNIVHWSLFDNPDYIFNLYNGFGPYGSSNNYAHYYRKTPDLLSDLYNEHTNNIGWINVRSITRDQWLNLLNIKSDAYYQWAKSQASNMMSNWINDVKYDNIDKVGESWNSFDLMTLICDKSQMELIMQDMYDHSYMLSYEVLDEIHIVRLRLNDDFYVLLVDNEKLDKVTFASFSKLLNKTELTDTHLLYLRDKMNSVKQVPLVSIDKSLYVVKSPSPSHLSDEVEYYKDNNALININYMLRYDGRIKPTFITMFDSQDMNFRYYKQYMTEETYKEDPFSKYSQSGFPPHYPSIQYCSVNKRGMDFKKWSNPIPIYIPVIQVQMRSKIENEEYTSIKSMIIYYLIMLYGLDETDTIKAEYIYNLYNVEYSYEYASPDNIIDYIYKIKLTLK